MGRVLLIIGAVIGGLVFALFTVVLISALVQPDANQSDEVVGSIFFMVIGLIVAVPCIFFAYRMGAHSRAPWSPTASLALAGPSTDLQQPYLAWFAWCRQTLGGDAVSLHADTMAAMSGVAAGNPTGAAAAEAARQASRIAALGAMPAAPSTGKVKVLSRIGASTVGLLEPSERVLVSFFGISRPAQAQMWGLAFGAIGSIIAASQMGAVFVTVTDRRVIALTGSQYGGLAKRITLIEPRSTVTAKFPNGLFGRRKFSLKGIGGGSLSMNVPRSWRPEALMALELLSPSVGLIGAGVGVIR